LTTKHKAKPRKLSRSTSIQRIGKKVYNNLTSKSYLAKTYCIYPEIDPAISDNIIQKEIQKQMKTSKAKIKVTKKEINAYLNTLYV